MIYVCTLKESFPLIYIIILLTSLFMLHNSDFQTKLTFNRKLDEIFYVFFSKYKKLQSSVSLSNHNSKAHEKFTIKQKCNIN